MPRTSQELVEIDTWAQNIEAKINANSPFTNTLGKCHLVIDPKGRKYIRVWKTRNGAGPDSKDRYAYCFIELATGNILKPATWRAPAKGVRGNIKDPDGSWGRGVTEYGAAYIR